MNTSQKILAAVGGITLVAALVLAYLIWDASSVRAEKTDELEGCVSQARQIIGKLPMKPNGPEIKVYGENVESYKGWCAEAERIVSSGDQVFEATTEAALKNQLVNEARSLAERPGRVNGKLVKSEFGFGFHDYIVGGKMPARADLKRLQREWYDIVTVLTILADSGALELADVRVGAVKKPAEEVDDAQTVKGRKGAKKRGKSAKRAAKSAEADSAAADAPAVTAFSVDFFIRPDGMVRALNAIATDPRFIVVENVRFAREHDTLAEALGGDAVKRDGAATAPRRRRRGGGEDRKVAVEKEKAGPVTDPATDPPLKVTIDFSVYDFRTLEKAKKEADGDKSGKGEDKEVEK